MSRPYFQLSLPTSRCVDKYTRYLVHLSTVELRYIYYCTEAGSRFFRFYLLNGHTLYDTRSGGDALRPTLTVVPGPVPGVAGYRS